MKKIDNTKVEKIMNRVKNLFVMVDEEQNTLEFYICIEFNGKMYSIGKRLIAWLSYRLINLFYKVNCISMLFYSIITNSVT